MTVEEYLSHCDVEGRKLRKIVFQTKDKVMLTGVQCDPKYTLDEEDIDDCLTDFDCQFNCDEETGKLTKPSIYTYPVTYEDTSKVREVTLILDTTNANQQLSKEDKEDAKT